MHDAIARTSEDYAPSKAALEWLTISSGMTAGTFLTSANLTFTLKGTAVKATLEPGQFPSKTNYYYIGQPGMVEYTSALTLTDEKGKELTFFFTPKRTSIMKPTLRQNNRERPISIMDILPGDKVSIIETVNLQEQPVNDEFVKSLLIQVER